MMRLGLSNLAWPTQDTAATLERLAACGVAGIEVAPTRIAAWDGLGRAEVVAYGRDVAASGLAVSSLQAIFYGRPELQLLGDGVAFAAMCEHLRLVAGVAELLGAGVAVFGAPHNRARGAMPMADAELVAADRLHRLGEVATTAGLVLAMEPVPASYGADFLCRAADVRRVVELCRHPAIRTHLDSACVTLAGDVVAEEISLTGAGLAHYHIAEPKLGGFADPTCRHHDAGAALRRIGYAGWLVIEMLEQPDGFAAVETAIRHAREAYG